MAINKNKIVAQAQRFTGKGQFEKAINEYQKLLKVEPNDIRTWLKVGDLYTRMGARKEATDTYLRVAHQYTKSGFHLKAIAVFKQILKIDPAQLEIHEFLANSYLDLGLTSEALIQLEQLVDMYQRTNHADLLLKSLQRMGEIDPHNIATKLRIAEHLSKENRNDEAVENFTAACAELKKQGRIDDYLKVAERLLYHDPNNVELAKEVSELYLDQEQYKHALAKLQACFVKDPRDLRTLELLAKAFQGLGQPDKAVSVYQEMSLLFTGPDGEEKKRPVLEAILQLDPNNQFALEQLGHSLAPATDDLSPPQPVPSESEAEILADDDYEELSSVEALSDEEIESKAQEILQEADILAKYGLLDRSLEHVNRVFEFYPYCIDARERMRDLLIELGRPAEAAEQLFFLVDVFYDTQPEGAVYYLHEILRVDPKNKKAREKIAALGGVMPDNIEDSASSLGDDGEQPRILEDDDDIIILDDEPLESDGDLQSEVQSIDEDDIQESGLHDLDLSSDLGDFDIPDSSSPIDDFEDDEKSSGEALEEPFDNGLSEESEPGLDLDELDEISLDDDDLVELEEEPDDISTIEVEDEISEIEVEAEAGTGLPDIDDELEEVTFFMDQGLKDEGKAALVELHSYYPDDPRVQGALAQFDEEPEPEPEPEPEEMDSETQYDLGTAYKEMGQFDKAIVEFEKAATDPKQATLAFMMIGMCYNGLERRKDAISAFIKGLKTENLDKQHELGLLYELGVTYQMMQKKKYALKCFKKIASTDKGFADVSSRIKALVGRKTPASKSRALN